MKWCTYGFFLNKPRSIGRLFKEKESDRSIIGTGQIQYAENQQYSMKWWDLHYVSVFESLEEAIIYLLKNSDETLNNIKDSLHFKEKENVDWEKLKNIK